MRVRVRYVRPVQVTFNQSGASTVAQVPRITVGSNDLHRPKLDPPPVEDAMKWRPEQYNSPSGKIV